MQLSTPLIYFPKKSFLRVSGSPVRSIAEISAVDAGWQAADGEIDTQGDRSEIGRVVWEQPTSQDYLVIDGGLLSTAGGVVFAGREDGKFVVL